jgi:hypothetical protein
MQEVWKEVPGTAGDYEISNLGNVRSWKMGNKRERATVPTLRKLRVRKDGKHLLVYSVGGERYMRAVHMLVLELFIGPAPGDPRFYDGGHFDEDFSNNAASNLFWRKRSFRPANIEAPAIAA